MLVQAFRVFIDTMYSTSLLLAGSPEKAAAAADAVGFVWVAAAPELVTGEIRDLAEANNVQPTKTCGFWLGSRGANNEVGQKASANEKVIYHLHGEFSITVSEMRLKRTC